MRGTQARDNWDQHWSEFGASYERNPAQEYRRRLIIRLLTAQGPPQTIADLGSGRGEMLAALAERYPEAALLGVEYSQFGTEAASQRVPRAMFLQRDLMVDPHAPDRYRKWATHAICSEVLEHVDEPVTLLRNAATFLAPGCRFVVTVPGGPMSAFDRHIGHRQHFSPSQLRDLLAAAGFHVDQAIGAGFPFFNLYRRVIILRGQKLTVDLNRHARPSLSARTAMAAFDGILHLPTLSRWGWQTVAVARLPEGAR